MEASLRVEVVADGMLEGEFRKLSLRRTPVTFAPLTNISGVDGGCLGTEAGLGSGRYCYVGKFAKRSGHLFQNSRVG